MQENQPPPLFTQQTWIFLAFIIFLSFFTYFFRYYDPPHVFWDENYHIASAQKYLNGVYFMEQHPPLGKLLAALGEKLLHPNARTDQFITTDYATDFPNDFSFAGFRLFSALLGWWTAPLLFLLFLLLTRNSLNAALLSFFYVFDNALIVHIRGAMLEGPLVFFSVLTILAFFLLFEWRERPRGFLAASALFGAAFGLTLTTKLFGLILILLLPAYLYTLLPDWKQIGRCLGLFLVGFAVVYVSVWQIHFALGSRIVTELPDNGLYQASSQYQQILATKKNGSLLSFPVMLRDSIAFVSHYNRGTPRLDLCKSDENGSPFYLWPLGGISINYRWETPDGYSYRYLYLQSNPVVWLTAFAALLITVSLLVGSLLFDLRTPLQNSYLLSLFSGLYLCYMIAVSQISRVLYLYHYFIPLILTFILLCLLFLELRRIGPWRVTEHAKTMGLLVLAGFVFISFEYYRPLTYYEPINDQQFQSRAILPIWELTCVHCQKYSPIAVACKAK